MSVEILGSLSERRTVWLLLESKSKSEEVSALLLTFLILHEKRVGHSIYGKKPFQTVHPIITFFTQSEPCTLERVDLRILSFLV